MYKTTLMLHPRAGDSATRPCEPSLFDEIGLELNETGKPWSPIDPPLADIADAPAAGPALQPSTDEYEPLVPIETESAATPETEDLSDDDTVILDQHELLPIDECAPAAEAAVEASPVMSVTPDNPTATAPIATIEEPVLEAPTMTAEAAPVVEEAVVAKQAPVSAAPVCVPIETPPLPPPMTAPANDRCMTQKTAALPKRIGSGRLVAARLTWKPRDPFASPSRPQSHRFRWEVMLTSACITAVCGLGCVWILRTLLA
jgi:hypothetical protein